MPPEVVTTKPCVNVQALGDVPVNTSFIVALTLLYKSQQLLTLYVSVAVPTVPLFVRKCVCGVLSQVVVCTVLRRIRHTLQQRRVLTTLCVCFVCTKCHLLTCSDIDTANCVCVGRQQVRRHASTRLAD